MGCSSSTITGIFKLNLYTIEKTNSIKRLTILKKVSVKCKIKEQTTLMQYILSNKRIEFKSLFETDSILLSSTLYFLYFENDTKKHLYDYSEINNFNVYDESKKGRVLKKIKMIDTRVSINLMEQTDIINQLYNQHKFNKTIILIPGLSQRRTLSLKESEVGNFDAATKEIEDDCMDSDDDGNFNDPTYTKIQIKKELNIENTEILKAKIENEKVTSFSIKHNVFRDLKYFEILMKALSKCGTLKIFTFSENINTTQFEEGWKLIFSLFKENKNIRHIDLSISFLYDKYIDSLLDSIKDKRIKTLDIGSNFITHHGCKKISDWLRKNKSLKIFNFQQNSRNEVRKEGSDMIAGALSTHPRIVSLDLSHMVLTGLGLKIGELIEVSNSLKDLRIVEVRMNLDDYKNILTPLKKNTIITHFDISNNFNDSDAPVILISQTISENSTLQFFGMDNVGLTPKNQKILFDSIEKNKSIRTYSLSNNSKMKYSTYLKFFIDKINVKKLDIYIKNYKKTPEDVEALQNFKIKRGDVRLII